MEGKIGDAVSAGVGDFGGGLLPEGRSTYRYDGSLTTPPCSEAVNWLVMTSPIQLSSDQIGAFEALVQGNNRPVQPRNDRMIVTDRVGGES